MANINIPGGTVDITAHEVLYNGSLKSLIAPNGGDWGGITVNCHFRNFLKRLFGDDVLECFAKEYKSEYLDIEREIEQKKKVYCRKSDTIILNLPAELYELFAELRNMKIEEALKISDLKNDVEKKRARLIIKRHFIESMYAEAKTSVIAKLNELLKKRPQQRPNTLYDRMNNGPHVERGIHLAHSAMNISHILMVGGFSDSVVMQEAVKEEFPFPEYNVIVPEEAGLAVVKGKYDLIKK